MIECGKDSENVGMGKITPIVVTAAEDGQRLDKWLRSHYLDISQVLIEKLCRTGQLRIDSVRVKPNTRVSENQKIRVPDFVRSSRVKNGSNSIKIPSKLVEDLRKAVIFKDKHFIIFNKPYGMAVQGGSKLGHYHLANTLSEFSSVGDPVPRLVHRLDKETSGVLIVARTPKSASMISEMMKQRKIKKIYWALVHKLPKKMTGIIFNPAGACNELARSELDLLLKKKNYKGLQLLKLDQEGKESITVYKVLGHLGLERSWLELLAITGRKHQLRKHLSSIGCPIIGDKRYGNNSNIDLPKNHSSYSQSENQKLHLHARMVDFEHPFSGERIKVTADPPFHMAKKLKPFL